MSTQAVDFSKPATLPPMPLQVARQYAAAIVTWLGSYAERVEVAGSIRRGRPWCNDVDLVVIPKTDPVKDLTGAVIEERNLMEAFLRDYVDRSAGAAEWLAGRATHCEQVMVRLPKCQLDVFFADEENWASRFLCRTGSKEHNIWLAMRAKSMGLHWAPYVGLMDAKRHVIQSATETDLFKRLGLEFITPERREK